MSADKPDWEKALSKEAVMRELVSMAIPVDYDQLCKEGILERVGKKRYKVPDKKRLPKHVRSRISKIDSDGVVEFEDTVKRAKKRLSKLKAD